MEQEILGSCLATGGMAVILVMGRYWLRKAAKEVARDMAREIVGHVAEEMRKHNDEASSFLREIRERNEIRDKEEIRFLLEVKRSLKKIGD